MREIIEKSCKTSVWEFSSSCTRGYVKIVYFRLKKAATYKPVMVKNPWFFAVSCSHFNMFLGVFLWKFMLKRCGAFLGLFLKKHAGLRVRNADFGSGRSCSRTLCKKNKKKKKREKRDN